MAPPPFQDEPGDADGSASVPAAEGDTTAFPGATVPLAARERRVAMKRILIVDDNELNRDVLSRRLTRRGYEVLVATSGTDGLSMAQTESPELILMDLGMPDLDGWECTRRLKADGATRRIPVIALTAHAMTGDRQKALDAGCDDFDTKPIEFARLLAKMENLLAESAEFAAQQAAAHAIPRPTR